MTHQFGLKNSDFIYFEFPYYGRVYVDSK